MPRARKPEDPRFSEIVRGRFGDAVRTHDVQAVRAAIEDPVRPIDVNVLLPSPTRSRETALFHTLGHTDLDVVDLLLAAGADVNHRSAGDRTPAAIMALAGNLLVLKRLHVAGARLSGEDLGLHPLHAAARNGRLGTVRWLMDQGVPLDAVNSAGRSALHEALMYPAVVQALLERGANDRLLDVHQRTPLEWAREQLARRPEMAVSLAVLEHWALRADACALPPDGAVEPAVGRRRL